MFDPTRPLDLDTYLPFFWTVIANRWTASCSREFLQRFGVGVVEWRVLATLGSAGQATSLDAARLAALDPAAASRAVGLLHEKGLITPVVGRFRGRSKPFEMTAEGREMFGNLAALAGERVDLLLKDLTAGEREQLLDLLRRVYARSSVT